MRAHTAGHSRAWRSLPGGTGPDPRAVRGSTGIHHFRTSSAMPPGVGQRGTDRWAASGMGPCDRPCRFAMVSSASTRAESAKIVSMAVLQLNCLSRNSMGRPRRSRPGKTCAEGFDGIPSDSASARKLSPIGLLVGIVGSLARCLEPPRASLPCASRSMRGLPDRVWQTRRLTPPRWYQAVTRRSHGSYRRHASARLRVAGTPRERRPHSTDSSPQRTVTVEDTGLQPKSRRVLGVMGVGWS